MLIATDSQVFALEGNGGEPEIRFEGEPVLSIAEADGCDVVAVADRLLVFAGGRRRDIDTNVPDAAGALLVLRCDPLAVLIGTEPPQVYRLASAGPAARIETFAELGCRDGWHTPWGGPAAVRSFAATRDGWVYADIHVGSIMRSRDHGATWEPVTPDLNEDVHQVATCPADATRVYANTARAVYVSEDRGHSWCHRADDLGARYGRAVAVHPNDPDLLLATVSDGPHGDDVHAQLWRSADAGRTWTLAGDPFPASIRENINTFRVAFTRDGLAWAAVGEDLYVGRSFASRWERRCRFDRPIRLISAR